MERRLSLTELRALKERGEPIVALTAYDAAFARILDRAGVEILLVGDSLGMVIQGQETTLAVTLDHMVYHSRCVAAGSARALVMADLPFLSCATPERAVDSAGRLLQEGRAQMVKLEAGPGAEAVVSALAAQGIPVCAHLGLLPQTVHKLGGYRVQGREPEAASAILRQARELETAGADMILVECIPAALAARLRETVTVPVIGIGAGAECDGQVLVLHDLLGVTPGPRFTRDFLQGCGSVTEAVSAYVAEVKARRFPAEQETLA